MITLNELAPILEENNVFVNTTSDMCETLFPDKLPHDYYTSSIQAIPQQTSNSILEDLECEGCADIEWIVEGSIDDVADIFTNYGFIVKQYGSNLHTVIDGRHVIIEESDTDYSCDSTTSCSDSCSESDYDACEIGCTCVNCVSENED